MAMGRMAIGITRVNSPDDAQKWVTRYHDAGFQQMKIYSSMKSDNVKAICADAHKLGMTVTGHIPNGMNAYEGVDDGMDMINHIHYITDLLLPKDFDLTKVKAPGASEGDGVDRRQLRSRQEGGGVLRSSIRP